MEDKKEPNFLLVTLEYAPFKGGVSSYYENMVNNWPGEIKVLTIPCQNQENFKENDVIRKKILAKKIKPAWLPAVFYIRQIILKKNIDHVLVGQILPIGTAVFICSKLLNIKYSVFLHGMDLCFALKKKRKRKLAVKILENADSVICANNYVKEIALKVISKKEKKKITVVNPGVSLPSRPSRKQEIDELKNKYGLQNKSILFSIGRIVERKGFDKVIEALPAIAKKKNDIVYVIAGSGPDENLIQDRIQKTTPSLRRKIITPGKISETEKWLWLNLCDVFLMPSRDIDGDLEGFGIVYLEANLAGKPVIGGAAGGVKDAISHGKNGYITDPNSPEKIAKLVISLLEDKKKRERMGREGRKRAINEFNWQKQTDKIYKHLKIL
jgi:phosphatidylinositol alpha-1,6-mannosyltransferase